VHALIVLQEMKIIWLIALVLVSHVCCAETYDSHHNSFAKETARAFELEEKADFVADYSTDGKLDIGVGRTDKAQGIHHSIRFSLEELEGFFDDQRHKDMIVVVVAKNVWTDEELQNHVLKLRDYFVARGYKKVVIQQGLGGGRGIHLEHDAKAKAEQAGTGQPATRPESKSEGGDKPQPESEGRSR
jgi:hypothetical protein